MYELNMRPNTTKGLLITFCGLDGSGKSTLLRSLAADLEKDHQIFITKQPSDFVRSTPIFRTYMDSPNHDAYDYRSLSLLAASDRVQHVNKLIEPTMAQGQIVLSDRYFYSCLANLCARGFSDDCWIYEIAESVIKPDIAFFFDLPAHKAISRVRSRAAERDRYIDLELQEKLQRLYKDICIANDGILISTDCDFEESYRQVKNAVEGVLRHGR